MSSASELSFHIIEAGSRSKPLILLLHGFPELAYSWRKIMPNLALAGFYVVAVDQRGYGRTTGWDARGFEDVDLTTFSVTNLIRDIVVLVSALGYHSVHCLVGHDFGSVTASACALARPDLFRRVVLMSHPFSGSQLPFDTYSHEEVPPASPDIHRQLAKLPEPRKHYKWYYSTAAANAEMSPQEGLYEFFRGYYHLKSADASNDPHPLQAWEATELARMPSYYVMPLHLGMREAIANDMTEGELGVAKTKGVNWLPDEELHVYVQEFGRTGFQGGLNWYRIQTDPSMIRDLDMFAGKEIEIPCIFIAGTKDWGIYQVPGALEKMSKACKLCKGVKLIEDAGHWVQQEQPSRVVKEIQCFIRDN